MVLAGPSGVGKGTVIRGVLEQEPGLWFSVSANTRARRPGEQDGVDYLFLSRPQFESLRAAGGFLEWFEVYGDLKGTPRAPVEEHLAAGDDVLLELDVQGALAVRREFPDAVLVFLAAPSPEEQRRRIRARGDADPADVERRLDAAERELALAADFDHIVVNDDVDAAVAQVAGILKARRSA
ncbi:MAG: guanylate kinase [Acidimicrobiia bacterium]